MNARQRRRRSARTTVIAAAVGLLILGALTYTALTAGNGLPFVSYFNLNARFANVAEIDPYSEVRIGGKLVGQTLGTSFVGGTAVVRMQLDPSVGSLRSDTTARIRLRGLIGAKYVELNPGDRGSTLPSGSTLPESQTSTSAEVFDVLSLFDAKRRTDLRRLLGGLGEGFAGRGGELNGALAQTPRLVSNIGAVTQTVNQRPGAATRFVSGSGSLAAAFDPVRQELASGFSPQAASLQPFSDERASVQATLDEAPGALDEIRVGLAQTDPLLVQLTRLSQALATLSRPAPLALQRTTRLMQSANAPLHEAQVMLARMTPAVPPVISLLDGLAPLARPFTRSLANSIPGLHQLGRYACDLRLWAHDWSEIFALGQPPQTPVGMTGLIRSALATTKAGSTANTPNGISARFYEPPCTAIFDRTPS